MKILRYGLVGVVLLLTACSSSHLTEKSSLALKPTPLYELRPSIYPKVMWHHVVKYGSGKYFLHLQPVMSAQGTLFIASYKGYIEALNTHHKGRRIWRKHYNYHFISGIVLNHGLLFVATADGHLLAIRQSNGCIVWSVITSAQSLASPQVGGKFVFVHSSDGVLTAYVAKNGELSWQQRETQPPMMLYLGSQPVVVGKKVLCGFADGRLVAFDLNDGHQLWARQVAEPDGMTEVSRMVDITSRPVVIDGSVYVVSYQGNLMALNLNNGDVFWKRKLSAFANIAATSKNLYLSDSEGYVWAFDRRSGAVIWRQAWLARRNLSAPAVIGSTVVVTDAAGYVHWLSIHDGHFVARQRPSRSSALTQPLVAQGNLYVYVASGKLTVYSGDSLK